MTHLARAVPRGRPLGSAESIRCLPEPGVGELARDRSWSSSRSLLPVLLEPRRRYLAKLSFVAGDQLGKQRKHGLEVCPAHRHPRYLAAHGLCPCCGMGVVLMSKHQRHIERARSHHHGVGVEVLRGVVGPSSSPVLVVTRHGDSLTQAGLTWRCTGENSRPPAPPRRSPGRPWRRGAFGLRREADMPPLRGPGVPRNTCTASISSSSCRTRSTVAGSHPTSLAITGLSRSGFSSSASRASSPAASVLPWTWAAAGAGVQVRAGRYVAELFRFGPRRGR